jgi:hypothetical protein
MTAERIRPALHLKRWLAACLLILAAVPVLAQSGGGYDLTWSTVDGGGGTFSTGGGYSLGGTAGQPDAGLMTGGGYSLGGGFWGGGAVAEPDGFLLYLPLVMRSY